MKVYPDTTVVSNKKAFAMMQNFFDLDLEGQQVIVDNGGTLSLGNHNLTFCICADGSLAGSYGNL